MARTVKPPRLKPGDTIAIIAPAGYPNPADLKLAAQRLKNHGYDVYIHPQCRLHRGYLAGNDKTRAQALMQVFVDKRIKAIFAARGGYGCQRILKYLDLDIIKANPKIFVGYSDLTVLLHAFNQQGLITFHGPMPAIDFSGRAYLFGLTNLLRVISGNDIPIELQNPLAEGKFKVYHKGEAEGVLTGGNLSLLSKLAGTSFMPSFKDKLVFIEDLNEKIYRIDSYLAHLFMTTDIAKAAGFIFAPLYGCKIGKNPRFDLTLSQVLDDYFDDLKVPIITNVACGHGNQNLTLPIGIKAVIDTGKLRFKLLESAVI
jgi:muramoyltetrapeptide carboxypeptidase